MQGKRLALAVVLLGLCGGPAALARNDGPADTSLAYLGLAYPHQLKEIALVDFAGRKQYDIGLAGTCLCSTFSGRQRRLQRHAL